MKKNLNNNSFNNSAVVDETEIKSYYISETVAYQKFNINGLNVYTVRGDTYSEVEKFLYYMTREFAKYQTSLGTKVSLMNENKLRKVDIERLKEFIALDLLASLYADEDKQLEYSVIHDDDTDFYYCDFLLQSASIHNKKVIVSKTITKDFSSIEVALPNDFTVAEVKRYLINNK